ncbi:SRPBCC family protein [Longimicrobium terrae]|nr:SRPBCC family protein [Longimicrobium terrae]
MSAQETQARSSTDRIEKVLTMRAPRSRVWRAVSTVSEFSTWFRVKLDGEFAEGATLQGDVSHADGRFACSIEMQIEAVQPERYFAYRWHPYPIPAGDYSAEAMTLVEFTLEDAEEGTLVTIVESGFDDIPLARRAEAFRMNDGGWTGQMKNLARHVE